jgi:ABC-type bacteriocin/lantibiotic exporter with double-glycine peptidase domain
MKKTIAQFLNEIVSITIMLLMAFALIAGQMSAGEFINETGAGKSAVVVTVDVE